MSRIVATAPLYDRKVKKSKTPVEVIEPAVPNKNAIAIIDNGISAVLPQAEALVVCDVQSAGDAAKFRGIIASLTKEVEKEFRPNIRRWHEGHKAAISQLNRYVKPLKEADKKLLAGSNKWQLEERHKKAAAERRIREAVARTVREELAREAQEAAVKAAEELSAAYDTDDAEKVEKLEQTMDAAELNEAQVEATVAEIVEDTIPESLTKTAKIEGQSSKVVYEFEVFEEDKIPRAFMMCNDRKIQALVSRKGFGASKICPGIVVREAIATRRTGKRRKS